MNNFRKNNGFSLVELMMVVSIIAMLATIVIDGRDSYYRSITRNQLQQVAREITILRDAKDDSLINLIRQNYAGMCPRCGCTNDGWLSDGCISVMDQAFRSIGFNKLIQSPWGAPLIFEVGEDSNNPGAGCKCDSIGAYIPRFNELLYIDIRRLNECDGATTAMNGVGGAVCNFNDVRSVTGLANTNIYRY